MLIDVMNGHGSKQLVQFTTREKNTLGLILTSLPSQFHGLHSPDKLSDHDVISATLKIHTTPPHTKKNWEKGDSMRKDASDFATGTSTGTQIIARFRKTLT